MISCCPYPYSSDLSSTTYFVSEYWSMPGKSFYHWYIILIIHIIYRLSLCCRIGTFHRTLTFVSLFSRLRVYVLWSDSWPMADVWGIYCVYYLPHKLSCTHMHKCRNRNKCSKYVKHAKDACSILDRNLFRQVTGGRWMDCVCVTCFLPKIILALLPYIILVCSSLETDVWPLTVQFTGKWTESCTQQNVIYFYIFKHLQMQEIAKLQNSLEKRTILLKCILIKLWISSVNATSHIRIVHKYIKLSEIWKHRYFY